MTAEDEKDFKSSNKCWICHGLYAKGDNKVRDHDHVTGKYRGSAHKYSNINLNSLLLPSYRSQSIDLLCKSVDRFPYNGNFGV